MTATYIRDLEGWNGTAKLWKMDPPLEGHEWVVSSAYHVPYHPEPETYLFGCDAGGKYLSGPHEGSFRGEMDHEKAIRLAGYEVVR